MIIQFWILTAALYFKFIYFFIFFFQTLSRVCMARFEIKDNAVVMLVTKKFWEYANERDREGISVV